jgi:hypothetical protein
MDISLPPFPVSIKMVPHYGRGRRYFSSAVPFSVPLLCWTKFSSNFLFFIIEISDDWLDWKLAIPQAAGNHMIVPHDSKGMPVKNPLICNQYMECTIAQIQRRYDDFWEKTCVLMGADTWIPMKLADPFNLLGFTCFGERQAVSASTLPLYSTYSTIPFAVCTVKPHYVPTPIVIEDLQPFLTVQRNEDVTMCSVETAMTAVKEPAARIVRHQVQLSMYDDRKQLRDDDKAELLVLTSQAPEMNLPVIQLLDEVFDSESQKAISLLRDYIYNCVDRQHKTRLEVIKIDLMMQWCVESTDDALLALSYDTACEECMAYFCQIQYHQAVQMKPLFVPVWVWISDRALQLIEDIDVIFYGSFAQSLKVFTDKCAVREAIEKI